MGTDGCLQTTQGSLRAVMMAYLHDTGLCRIHCCALLYRTEALSFHCVWVLQIIHFDYRQWKMKTSVSAQKSLIDRALPKTKSNAASTSSSLSGASSLAQITV